MTGRGGWGKLNETAAFFPLIFNRKQPLLWRCYGEKCTPTILLIIIRAETAILFRKFIGIMTKR